MESERIRVAAVVVGGGHAGIEASWALSRLGHRVALVSFAADAVGRMSCNPSIGGLAKGQLVREIDALGGVMGRLADRTGIHFRMLNRRKGPAVHAPRAQSDKQHYSAEAGALLSALPNLTLIEGEVTEIVTEPDPHGRRVVGVRIRPSPGSSATGGGAGSPPDSGGSSQGSSWLRPGGSMEVACRAVIVTCGTFLNGRLFTGMDVRPGGRRGEPPSTELALALRRLGLHMGRLKTGTPPRLRGESIDFARLESQPGDEPPPRFSYFEPVPVRNRVCCHLTRTNARTHAVISAALDRSPLFGGLIEGIGPRYCPSIEDKVVQFPERRTHHIFLEPQMLEGGEIYPNGISTSLSEDVQEAYVHTIRGLEKAEIVHAGYAVEYDFLLTSQLDVTLRVRGIAGLYSAGQINGTSGYEEAAAQGLMAGLNARAFLENRPAAVLRREEAYIGVLLDDLVTKVPTEPYRMFTSQSEYRLLMRQDNADLRLCSRGHEWGLLGDEDLQRVMERRGRLGSARAALRRARGGIARTPAGRDVGKSWEELLKRPDVSLDQLIGVATGRRGKRAPGGSGAGEGETAEVFLDLTEGDRITLEADIKYDGYITRQLRTIEKTRSLEEQRIPRELVETPPTGLSREARAKLCEHRPRTLGQASRIPGITPCDISLLAIRIHAKPGGRRRLSGESSGEKPD